MEPKSTCPSRPWNAHNYRKWLASHIRKRKAHGESETEIFSVERRSQNVTRPWDLFNKKPRSKRKRSTKFWPNKVSENIKTTVELRQVKNSESTSPVQQGLKKNVRKQRLQKQSLADQLIELEEGEIPPSPSPSNHFDSTSNKNDVEAEIYVSTERQTVFHKLKDLGVKIPKRSRHTNDSCQRGSKEGKISVNPKKGDVLDDLIDMKDGEILTSPHNQMLTDKHKEGWDDRNCETGISLKSLGTSLLTLRDMEEQLKVSIEIVQLGKETDRAVTMVDGSRERSLETSQLTSRDVDEELKTNDEELKTNNEIVRSGKETERPVMTVDDRDCQTLATEQGLGISQEQFKTHIETIHLGKETDRPVITSNGLFKGDTVQPTDVTAICSGSPKAPAHVSDNLLDKKELSPSTVGTVVVVESDTYSDVVELTGQRSVTSTSNVNDIEVNSSFNGCQDGTRSTSVGKQSPAQCDRIPDSVARPSEDPHSPLDDVAVVDQPAECSGETIPASNIIRGPEGLTSVKKQITHKNKEKIDFIIKSSSYLQNSSHEVIMVDQPAECSTNDLPIEEQSVPIEVANLPGSQNRGTVSPACTEFHLQLTRTSTSVVPPDVSAVESISNAFNQPPVSSVSVSLQHGLLNTPLSTGNQCPQSVGRHTSGAVVQPSAQPLSEEAMQFSVPSSIDLQPPQLRSMQMSGNDLHFFNAARSGTNVQDFSMATGFTSMSDLLLHANVLMPGSTQHPCHDPLQLEIDRLKKHHEHDLKMHEDMVLRMKSKRDEDIEELLKKYDILFQDAEAAMQHKTMDFETKLQKVCLNKLLANAVNMMLKHNDHLEAFTPDTRQAASGSVNQLPQNATQTSLDRLDQHPVPSGPVINQPSPFPTRPCSGGLMDCSTDLYQYGYGLRAVAPHIRASRPCLHYPVPNNGEFMQYLPR